MHRPRLDDKCKIPGIWHRAGILNTHKTVAAVKQLQQLSVGATVAVLSIGAATAAVVAMGRTMNAPREKRCGTCGVVVEHVVATAAVRVRFLDDDTGPMLWPVAALRCVDVKNV